MNGGMNGMNGGVQGNQFEGFVPPGQNAQQKNIEVYAQSLANQHRVVLNNTASPQGMTAGVQNSPMPHPGLDGQENMFSGNGPRPGMPANAPGAPQGNHALQDYQMQLMLLEQQNKRRLLMARQEQDSIPGPHQGPGGTQGFPAAMSPQGGRPGGPSPNPADQMKPRGTPKMSQSGSPLPEGSMPQRGSPAPNMNFDPSLAPPGMPPQFYPQIPQQSPMMRPPSSHPVANLNGQALTQQQMEAMRNGQMAPNGVWRGPQQPGMMPGQQPMGGPIGNNPQQRPMPPPPAPTNDVPRPEPSPSQSNQAPPTPSQPTKGNPKKKPTKDNNNKVLSLAFCKPLSNINIDCRSPQTKKGRTQVQLQQHRQARNRRRRHHRPLLLPSRRIRSSRSTTRMANPISPYNHSRYSSSPWTTTCLRLAISNLKYVALPYFQYNLTGPSSPRLILA
jgi:hypothetical protein